MRACRRLSIIIRNYNYGRFLRDAIDSALAQTYPLTEVVIVDDGSTDDSRNILAAYGARCRVILKENGGEASAANAGFAASTGDIVLFLDSDDVLAPEAGAIIAAAWDDEITRMHFPLYAMTGAGKLLRQTFPPFMLVDLSLEEQLSRFGHVMSGGQTCNAYAAWALRHIFPLDEKIWICACDACLNALTMVQGRTKLLHQPLGGYRFHESNLTLRNSLDIGVHAYVVLIHPSLHETLKDFVGSEQWKSFKPVLPAFHWVHRLLSLRLNPSHPFCSDRLLPVLLASVNALRRIPGTGLGRQLFLLSGIVVIAIVPRGLLRRLLPVVLRAARAANQPRRGRAVARHWRDVFSVPQIPS